MMILQRMMRKAGIYTYIPTSDQTNLWSHRTQDMSNHRAALQKQFLVLPGEDLQPLDHRYIRRQSIDILP